MKTIPLFVFLAAMLVCSADSQALDSIFGCTDPNASNFNPLADTDDGTCCYQHWVTIESSNIGMVYMVSYNYDTTTFAMPGSFQLCLEEACYRVQYYSTECADFTINIFEGNTELFSATTNPGSAPTQTFTVGNGGLSGCTWPTACNYNPLARCENNSCEFSCYGCTDPAAPNYSAENTIDDGSCCYENYYFVAADDTVLWWYVGAQYAGGYTSSISGFCFETDGCSMLELQRLDHTQTHFTVYSAYGDTLETGYTDENGHAIFYYANPGEGCGDPNACNFTPGGTCTGWGACDYQSCRGCMDSSAPNYDPDATIDNGQCCYDDWYTLSFDHTAYWRVNTESGGLEGFSPQNAGFCNSTGCFHLFFTTIGEVESVTCELRDPSGNLIGVATTVNGQGHILISANGEIPGCTDATSCNYNPNATCAIWSMCGYCSTCSDPMAINYNPFAAAGGTDCIYDTPGLNLVLNTQPMAGTNSFMIHATVTNGDDYAPYLFTDANTGSTYFSTTSEGIFGPFECGAVAELHTRSLRLNVNEVTEPQSITQSCALNVDEQTSSPLLSIFPNPNAGIMTVQHQDVDHGSLQVLDLTGRIVHSMALSAGSFSHQLNITSLPEGIYQVRIFNEQTTQSASVVIQH